MSMLLEKGAEVDATDTSGETALMFAAGRGKAEVVRVLLEQGAEVDAINKIGEAALMMAARLDKKKLGGAHAAGERGGGGRDRRIWPHCANTGCS
jgi:ankyrin repeat protein